MEPNELGWKEITAAPPVNGIGLRHSSTMGELGKALAAASLDFDTVVKAEENPFYTTPKKKAKYADLAEMIRATRPALSKHGLAVLQSPRLKNHSVQITTMLLHSSGEWIQDDLELPADQTMKFEENGKRVTKFDASGSPIMKFDPQTVGSAIAYARRYSYGAILNIAGEEDDDGNAASANPKQTRQAVEEEYSQIPEHDQRITQSQAEAFLEACKKAGKTEAQIIAKLETFGYLQAGQIKKGQWNAAILWAGKVNSPDTAEKLTEAVKDSVLTVKMRKLFAVMKTKDFPESDLNRYIDEAFGLKSKKELTSVQIDRCIEFVEGVA
jgi:hypothetical protein